MNHISVTADEAKYYERLGQVVGILNQTPNFHYSVAAVVEWSSTPAQLGQIAFCGAPGFSPIAYMTWAYLSREMSKRMALCDVECLHFSEWNEGTEFWVIDLVSVLPIDRAILRRLIKEAGVEVGRKIHWMRQCPNSIAKSFIYRG